MSFITNMPIKLKNSYTPNGSRLISKIKNVSKNIQGANFYTEIIKIETNFGKGLTTVTTTFDATDKPVTRIIEKRQGKKSEKTIFKYSGIFSVRRKTVIDKFINKEKVQRIIKSEILTKDKERPFLTRILLYITPQKDKSRDEIQIIEELSTKKHRRYIKTTAKRNKDGELSEKTIEGNVKGIKQFTNSIYLYFRNYPLKDFLISIIPYAKRLQKVSKREIEILFDTLNKKVSANSTSDNGFGTVKFDMKKLKSQSNIVETVNHEFRHQYQDSVIEKFMLKGFKSMLRRTFMPLKYIFAKHCSKDKKKYVSAAEDYERYLEQYIEIDARLAGQKAKNKFLAETRMIEDIFPKCKELFTGNDEFFNAVISAQKATWNKDKIKIS